MKTYHIVFKLNTNDFFSTGKNYEVASKEDSVDEVIEAINKWKQEFPLDRYPNKEFLFIYSPNIYHEPQRV